VLQAIKKYRIPLLTVFAVLFIDQFIKIYIKSHYPINQEVGRLADWCRIHFTENPGMAFGYEFGGNSGKLILSLLRIAACIGGIFYIKHIVKLKEHPGFIFSVALILAGAMGNILDSAFYGLIFDRGTLLDPITNEYVPYMGIAQFGKGYAPSMYGCVVDMFYFPMVKGHFPSWFPFWPGEEFEFFRPIFNFADASISVGVILIIIFQKKFSKKSREQNVPVAETPAAVTDDPASHMNAAENK
jgi:signal peptidase II